MRQTRSSLATNRSGATKPRRQDWRARLLSLVALSGVSCTGPSMAPLALPPEQLAIRLTSRAYLVSQTSADRAARFVGSRARSLEVNSVASATPVAPDGYLLTAEHAIRDAEAEGQTLIVVGLARAGSQRAVPEVVWRDPKTDLALLKVPFPTPDFYPWTPRGISLPAGTPVVHGGVTTMADGQVGRLLETMREASGSGGRRIRHDLKLLPGDSGGPLVALNGELIAIHHAIRFEGVMDTAFFTGAESTRPNQTQIQRIMDRHRQRQSR
jgi:S1-C subfamily serine protease